MTDNKTNQCVVCYREGADVTFKCIQCNNSWLCGECIAQMQENGSADKCPVCRKGSPWSNNLRVVVESSERRKSSLCYNSQITSEDVDIDIDDERIYYGKQIRIWTRKFALALFMLCLCYLTGYIFVISNDGKMRQDAPYPIIMSIVIYTAIGFMILMMCGLVLLVCGGCVISCLSLGIPQENM